METAMKIKNIIQSRRSIRKFTQEPVDESLINEILETGRWAPSGLNNQPWRFIVVRNKEIKEKISNCTKYKRIICDAQVLIIVFLDNDAGYNRTKDVQAIGACIQNMLLMCHSLNLGACWLGEILNRREDVEKLLEVPSSYELMAVLAIGYPNEKGSSSRKKLTELVVKRI